ncbi:MAG: TonB-dependent receptor [Hyphomonadaceae bacterium]|nr:TonB-dependent receptor [Hyphomonadaceae bacterium]
MCQTPSSSDDTVASEGELVVTARRREERLVDVPTAASVISGEALAARGGAATSGELLADQPSVRFNNLNSSITSEISIRASSTARATNGDPSVGLYRNGSYIGGGGIGGRNFTRLDFLDIGRVEVLRGTQGALYGRNAVGGAVNIVAAQPVFEHEGFLNARYGFDNESLQVQGAVNIPVGADAAFRFSGEVVDQESGFFFNPQNNVYFDQTDGYGLRGQFRLQAGKLDLLVLAETQDLTTPAIHYQLAIAPGTPGFPGGYTQDQFNYPWNTAPRATQDVDGLQIVATYDFGAATLVSTTHYRERASQYDLDSDAVNPTELARARAAGQVGAATPVDANAASYIKDITSSLSQDVHLNGDTAGGRLTWLVGAEALLLESDYSVETLRTPTVPNPSTGSFAPASLNYDSYAAYGSLGFSLTERLNLTGELRYTADDRSLSARLRDRVTGAPLGGAARVVDTGIETENLSYNATAAFRLTDDVLVYGKAGTSYRAGGFNTNLGDTRQPVPIDAAFDDETATSFEAGVKGVLLGRTYFAVAAYTTELSDLIAQTDNGCAVTNPVCPVAATSFLTNAGDASSWGAEGEVVSKLGVGPGDLRIALTASRQGGEVDSGRFRGLSLPQVPDWLGSASFNYLMPISDRSELFGNVLYTAQWGGVQELRANSVKLDDFQLVNLRAGVRFGHVSMTAFANNVFDQVYVVARDTTVRRYSQPRVAGVELGYRW